MIIRSLCYSLPLLLAGLSLPPVHAAEPILAPLPLSAEEINKADRFGATPFLDAILEGDVELVAHMIAAGADVNHIPVIAEEILLIGDNPYYTPLLMACEASNPAKVRLAELLLRAGADPNLTLPASKWTALMSAASANDPDSAALVRLLLKAKAAPHLKNDDGATALLLAGKVQAVESIQALLAAGADPKIIDAQGDSIYHAILEANHAIMDTPPNKGVPARVTLIQMLHRAGADINRTNHEGDTALLKLVRMSRSYSSEQESLAIARCLIELGAKPQLKNKQGDTALSLAQKEGNQALADYLKSVSK